MSTTIAPVALIVWVALLTAIARFDYYAGIPFVRIVFDSDIVVCHEGDMIVPETFHHESSVIHPIAIHNPALMKKDDDPVMRHKIKTQVRIPKMVVSNEREIVGAQAKIHVGGHHAVVI